VTVPNADELRTRVVTWFEEAWDPDISLLDWRRRLLGAGWAVPSWPTDWFGRDLPAWTDKLVHETIRRAGGVTVPPGGGMGLAAPTMLEHGSDDLRGRLLGPTVTGEITWCQLFSEPGAGSDLAGLTTTAIRDGDDWIVSGQKVWTTSAHHADMGMLLARTSWDVPKHDGLTYFALPMHQPGVEVRPIRQMNHHASFNEVFLSECRVPDANVIGTVGDGWRVARTTLMHERTFATQRTIDLPPEPCGRVVTEARAEAVEHMRTYVWYPQRAGRADLLVERARARAADSDPVVRQAIADALAVRTVGEWTAGRAKRARELGKPPGPEGSLGKLAASELARRCHGAHTRIAGVGVIAGAEGAATDDVVREILLSTPAQSIAGGTDEIQRNILGERILGLPREPGADRAAPFREIPR
jgi:alkylation response protein AidB-like acyl-CoA dehydrogenase